MIHSVLLDRLRLVVAAVCGISCTLASASAFMVPVITEFEPGSGAPGISVTIRGTDLHRTLEVLFGTAPAVFTVLSPGRLVTTVPLDATTGPISIVGDLGTTASPGVFRVAPRIVDFFPTNAPPNARILISGFNFEGTAAVRFNGTNAPLFVTSETQIQTIVPVGATNGPIRVITPAGVAVSDFDFVVAGNEPFINSFTPEFGAPGDRVTIEGGNFAGVTGLGFDNRGADFFVTSPSQITATVPPSASSGFISITNAFGEGESIAPFIVTTAPVVTGFEPFAGPPGTDVVVNGANFTGATGVKVGGTNAFFALTAPTQMHVTVPAGATNGPITVTTPRGTGSSVEFFLASPGPIITEFNPTSGPPGTQIAVSGFNFSGLLSARINGTNAPFAVTASTQIAVTVPANATTGPISLTTTAGTATTIEPFLIRTGRPIITRLDPPAGPGRSTVLIEGLDLSSATSVRFNNTPALFSAVADTQITALVPDGATSGQITVTTPAGSIASSNRFIVAPVITEISPATGVFGTSVNIRGTNLADVTVVRFREAVASFEHVGTNQLVAVVPNEAITGSINLISPGGIVAATNFFVVLPQVNRFTPPGGPAGTRVTIIGSGFSDVLAVRFGDVNAQFQVISSTEIQAIVPPQAVTGPITVTTAAGSATSARSFAVGMTADLAVTQTQSTNAPMLNQVLTYTIAVTNLGPSIASGVVLSNRLPATVLPLSIAASQGTVTQPGGNVRVDVGSLPNGGSVTLTIDVLPGAAGTITNVASVTGLELDPDLVNNTAAQVTTILTNVARLDAEQLEGVGVEFSWPAAATNFVLQSIEGLASPRSWQPVATEPVEAGDRKVVTVPTSGSARFFRLIRPNQP